MMRYILFSLTCILLLSGSSCVEELDFDQVDTFVLPPNLEVSLVYFDFLASDFDENDPENDPSYIDSTRADLFSKDFFQDNLREAEFTIRHINTVERDYKAEIGFWDEQWNSLYMVNVDIPAYNGAPQEVNTPIFFDESQIDILKNTYTITARITLLPGTPKLDSESSGSIRFESSVILFMAFE